MGWAMQGIWENEVEWKKLLWDIRRRYSRFRVQKAKDFESKSNVRLVQNFKQKNDTQYFEIEKHHFGCSRK